MRATLLGNGDRERLTLPSPLARARESHFYSTGAARESVGNSEPRKRRSPTRSLSITTSHGLPSTGEATDYLLEARPPASVGSIFDFLLERRRFDRPAAASTRLRRLPGRTDATSRPRRGSQAATNQLLQRLAAAPRDLYDVGEVRCRTPCTEWLRRGSHAALSAVRALCGVENADGGRRRATGNDVSLHTRRRGIPRACLVHARLCQGRSKMDPRRAG
jgi:hypothetical protein